MFEWKTNHPWLYHHYFDRSAPHEDWIDYNRSLKDYGTSSSKETLDIQIDSFADGYWSSRIRVEIKDRSRFDKAQKR
jgi:hypothetical protein